jgi:hypothetical protein
MPHLPSFDRNLSVFRDFLSNPQSACWVRFQVLLDEFAKHRKDICHWWLLDFLAQCFREPPFEA